MPESDLSELATSSEDEDNVVVKPSIVNNSRSPRQSAAVAPPSPGVAEEAPAAAAPLEAMEAAPSPPTPAMPTMSRTAPLPAFQPRSNQRRSAQPKAPSPLPVASTSTGAAEAKQPSPAPASVASTSNVESTEKAAAPGDKPKRNRVRTVGDADEECPICAAVPASQRRSTTRKEDRWIACDACDRWFHWESCVKKYAPPKTTADSFDEWYCMECLKAAATSGIQRTIKVKELQRKSSRKKADVKYASTSSSKTGPNPWHTIAESRPLVSTRFREMAASALTLSWLASDPRAFSEPIFIASPEGLDMRVLPADIKISEIASLVGPDTPIDVIDVHSQSGLNNWTLGRWAEYYEASGPRDRIRNVISLELSSSPIKDRIASPKLVRDIDWVEQYWPKSALESGIYPKVSRYCLMSPGLSWTDWHIDFSASSVFYHILRGSKVFYFIAPTPANLRAYEAWSGSSEQSQTWLGDLCDRVYRVELQKGHTMIIPSGWIHCVYTPTDALVIGGNFLHDWNIALQLRVYQIELATKVPRRFRFPDFVKTLWYVGWHHYNALARSEPIHPRILNGLKALSAFLIEQAYRITAPGGSAPGAVSPERRRLAKEAVPWELFPDPAAVAKSFQERVYQALGELPPPAPGVNADGVTCFPTFNAQEWLGPEWTYSLPPEANMSSTVLNSAPSHKRKAPVNGIAESPASKTAKFKHFTNGNGPAVPNGNAAPTGEKKPRFRNAPAINGHANNASPQPDGKATTGQPVLTENQSIPPYTVQTKLLRQRPDIHVQVDNLIDPTGRPNLAAGLSSARTNSQEQEAEVKTTYSQNTVRKTMPGPEEGSWIVETRTVVTTIERAYFAPLPVEEAMQVDGTVKDEEDERPMEVLALQAASENTSVEQVM